MKPFHVEPCGAPPQPKLSASSLVAGEPTIPTSAAAGAERRGKQVVAEVSHGRMVVDSFAFRPEATRPFAQNYHDLLMEDMRLRGTTPIAVCLDEVAERRQECARRGLVGGAGEGVDFGVCGLCWTPQPFAGNGCSLLVCVWCRTRGIGGDFCMICRQRQRWCNVTSVELCEQAHSLLAKLSKSSRGKAEECPPGLAKKLAEHVAQTKPRKADFILEVRLDAPSRTAVALEFLRLIRSRFAPSKPKLPTHLRALRRGDIILVLIDSKSGRERRARLRDTTVFFACTHECQGRAALGRQCSKGVCHTTIQWLDLPPSSLSVFEIIPLAVDDHTEGRRVPRINYIEGYAWRLDPVLDTPSSVSSLKVDEGAPPRALSLTKEPDGGHDDDHGEVRCSRVSVDDNKFIRWCVETPLETAPVAAALTQAQDFKGWLSSLDPALTSHCSRGLEEALAGREGRALASRYLAARGKATRWWPAAAAAYFRRREASLSTADVLQWLRSEVQALEQGLYAQGCFGVPPLLLPNTSEAHDNENDDCQLFTQDTRPTACVDVEDEIPLKRLRHSKSIKDGKEEEARDKAIEMDKRKETEVGAHVKVVTVRATVDPRQTQKTGSSCREVRPMPKEPGAICEGRSCRSGIDDAAQLPRLGGFAVTASRDAALLVWDVASWAPVGGRLVDCESCATSVWACGSSRSAVSGSYDRSIRIWDLVDRRCTSTIRAHAGAVTSVCADFQARRVLSASLDKTLKFWDIDAPDGPPLSVLAGHEGAVNTACAEFQRSLAISGSRDHSVRLWDMSTGRCHAVLQSHKQAVLKVRANFQLSKFFSCSHDGSMRLWDLEVLDRPLRALSVEDVPLTAADSDGHLAFTASAGRQLTLWDLHRSRGKVVVHDRGSAGVTAVGADFSRHIAVCGLAGGALHVWDLRAGLSASPLARLKCHRQDITGICLQGGST